MTCRQVSDWGKMPRTLFIGGWTQGLKRVYILRYSIYTRFRSKEGLSFFTLVL